MKLSVVRTDGTKATVAVNPVDMSAYNDWAGPYGLHLADARRHALPRAVRGSAVVRSHRRIGDALRPVQPGGVSGPQGPRRDWVAARAPETRRVVLDIRHNYGGQLSGYRPLLALLTAASFHPPDGLFVITGRNTFSAASLFAAELDHATDAHFVGEPMGGSLNLYGNSAPVTLTNSGIVVQVATTWEEAAPGDDRLTIQPDLPAPLTSADFFAGRDPAPDAILGAVS